MNKPIELKRKLSQSKILHFEIDGDWTPNDFALFFESMTKLYRFYRDLNKGINLLKSIKHLTLSFILIPIRH